LPVVRVGAPRRVLLAVLTIVAATATATATAGCGASPPVADSASNQNSRPTVRPGQPFDVLLGKESSSIELVRLRIRDRCLADAGYPQNLDNFGSWRPPDPFEPLLVSARSFGPISEEEARRLGFGVDYPGEPARIVSFDSGYDTNLERCEKQAWGRLGNDAKQTMSQYMDLFNLLAPYRYEVDREVPADLPVRLYDCMVKKNYRADREAFLKTPNYTLFDVQFGSVQQGPEEGWQPANRPGTVQVGPAIPPRRYTPTPAEAQLAVAWFQCSKETGRVEAQLAAAFVVQRRFLDRYESRITELNNKVRTLARAVADLLATI
jgi:hypothetical protein